MRCTLCQAINTATPIAAVQPLLQIARHVQMLRLPLIRAKASAPQAANKAISVRARLTTNTYPSAVLLVIHRTPIAVVGVLAITAQMNVVIRRILVLFGAMLAAMITASFAKFSLRLKRLNRLPMSIWPLCHCT
jgi:uncharacterized membrane protein